MAKRWSFLRGERADDGPIPVPAPVVIDHSQNGQPDEAQNSEYIEPTLGDEIHWNDEYHESESINFSERELRADAGMDIALNEGQHSGPDAEIPLETGQSWLAIRGVGKSFSGRKVVSDVSLILRQGEAVGLLGPNGAGKTTVFYMIMGLLNSDTGQIELDGKDITHLPMYQRARLGIGYLPQEASIFRGLSVESNIRAVLELVEPKRKRREEQLDALLDEFKITHIRKSPSIALSGGERRRVEIARALASRPSFMLLDEPFAGVDPIAIDDIRNLVRHLTNRGIGVLITDHNVRETLSLINRAYIIYSGTVLMEGTPDEILDNEEVRRLYLGEKFTL